MRLRKTSPFYLRSDRQEDTLVFMLLSITVEKMCDCVRICGLSANASLSQHSGFFLSEKNLNHFRIASVWSGDCNEGHRRRLTYGRGENDTTIPINHYVLRRDRECGNDNFEPHQRWQRHDRRAKWLRGRKWID